jgi:tRNA pseudouridine38-40 synthase
LRIRLDLAYDGSDFFGWAKQPGLRSVQEELEIALAKVIPGAWGSPVPTVVAGRTDTGVHAAHQVVHFDVDDAVSSELLAPVPHLRNASPPAKRPIADASKHAPRESLAYATPAILHRLRSVLPEDIAVYRATLVHPEFSARFWARRRTYKYRLCDDLTLYDPLRRKDVHFVKRPLNVKMMNKAIKGFTGLHDFATFVKPRQGATSTRDLHYFKFGRVRRGVDKGLVVATLKADAFAYNMVRSLVGAAVLVGQGVREVGWMQECLDARTRQGATGPIAAKGLTLEHVDYISSPSRAQQRAKDIRVRR